MATFSIGDDEEDQFDLLRKAKPTMTLPSGKAGKVTKLGAVPLKTAEPAKGGLFEQSRGVLSRNPSSS